MQFSTLFAATAATLLSTASAQGIFAIQGNTTTTDTITLYLEVLNGNVGDAPICSGTTVNPGTLPISGNLPCVAEGYSLSYTWSDPNQGIQATYATPSSAPFTYNVPKISCQDNVCQWGFQDIFNDKAEALEFISSHN